MIESRISISVFQDKNLFLSSKCVKMKTYTILFSLILLLMVGCGSGPSKDQMAGDINKFEKALYGNDKPMDVNKAETKTQMQGVVDAYQQYADAFPDDEQSPAYLFKGAEVLRTLKDYSKAIQIYRTIHDKYPKYEKAPHSLFLMGFSYENDLKDLEKAKQLYKEFIDKYPKHELADDVQFSMQNLGKSPEEIIKSFEKNNNVQSTDTVRGGSKPAIKVQQPPKAAGSPNKVDIKVQPKGK